MSTLVIRGDYIANLIFDHYAANPIGAFCWQISSFWRFRSGTFSLVWDGVAHIRDAVSLYLRVPREQTTVVGQIHRGAHLWRTTRVLIPLNIRFSPYQSCIYLSYHQASQTQMWQELWRSAFLLGRKYISIQKRIQCTARQVIHTTTTHSDSALRLQGRSTSNF